ncbi:DNA endonuclease SmrA [Luminiphilus syltensis]|nr:DNA endonuclease SmrA [Luminiphilus syltensis]
MTEDDLFESEMAGVKPLRSEPRERLIRTPKTVSAEARREAAEGRQKATNPLVDEGVEPLDGWFVLNFKRPGIQNGVFKKLRMGRYDIDARLDLHRMTVKTARDEVMEFVRESMELGLRTVLILHGKGQQKIDQQRTAVIKGYVNRWLQDIEDVQAYHSAQPVHGGTGAVYVLLRKSAEKKRENRERFMKGRVPYDNR